MALSPFALDWQSILSLKWRTFGHRLSQRLLTAGDQPERDHERKTLLALTALLLPLVPQHSAHGTARRRASSRSRTRVRKGGGLIRRARRSMDPIGLRTLVRDRLLAAATSCTVPRMLAAQADSSRAVRARSVFTFMVSLRLITSRLIKALRTDLWQSRISATDRLPVQRKRGERP